MTEFVLRFMKIENPKWIYRDYLLLVKSSKSFVFYVRHSKFNILKEKNSDQFAFHSLSSTLFIGNSFYWFNYWLVESDYFERGAHFKWFLSPKYGWLLVICFAHEISFFKLVLVRWKDCEECASTRFALIFVNIHKLMFFFSLLFLNVNESFEK